LTQLRQPFPTRALGRGISLLLALLFLYNPFLGLSSFASGDVNFNHHASYRATVASAEVLQHFSPVNENEMFGVMLATLAVGLLLLGGLHGAFFERFFDSVRVSTPLICADLWFRPPPVA
jgi:hypothetical protein